MKKKILILITIISTMLLTGCNYSIIDGHYDFDKIICDYNGNKFELHVDEWKDYDGEQLQIKSNGKTYLLSANNCYMIDE